MIDNLEQDSTGAIQGHRCRVEQERDRLPVLERPVSQG